MSMATQPAQFQRIRERLPGVPELRTRTFEENEDRWYSYKLTSLHQGVAEVRLPGDYLQLGVYKGHCARFLAGLIPPDRTLYLLDSFEGLPEDWVGPWKKGAFSLAEDEIPRFDAPNVEVVPGWFCDTVPLVAERLRAPLALIHADADLYSSTLEALAGLDPRIAPGTVIVFDEYFMQVGERFQDDEHRALLDWCAMYDRDFEYLWKTEWVQVAVRITR
jgi:hypothetical protein